jgi:hypothetical protein
MALTPREHWTLLSHQLIFHGRRACKARNAACGTHPICAQFATCCELKISAPRNAKPKPKPKPKPKAPAKSKSKPKPQPKSKPKPKPKAPRAST